MMRDGSGNTGAAGGTAFHTTSPYAGSIRKYEQELARLERKSAEWKGVMSDPTQPPGRQKALFGRLQGSEASGRPAPGTVNARALRLRAQIDALKLAERVYQADPTTETRRRLDTYLNRGARIRDERDWVWNERKALRTVQQEVEKLQGLPGFGNAQTQYAARYNAYLKRGGALRALEGQHEAERKTFQNYQPKPAPTAPPFGSRRTPSRTEPPQPGVIPAGFVPTQNSKPTTTPPVKPRPGASRGRAFNPFSYNVYGHQPDFGEWAGQQAVKGIESIGRVLGFGGTIDASKLPSKQYAELYPPVYLSEDDQQLARELAEIGQLRPHVAGVISPFVKAYRSELGRLPRTTQMLIQAQAAAGVGAPGPSAEELRKAVPQEVYDQRYAEAIARSLGGMNEQGLIASFEAKLGRPLTSLQKKAVGAIAAAERLKLLNEGNYTQALSGDLRNVVISYAAGAGAGQFLRYLKGPAAGLAQKLGTRLPPKTQAAITTPLGKTSTQAQRLTEPVRRKVPPVVREALIKTLDPVEHTAAGVSEAAIQAFEVASDPHLTSGQRAEALQRAFVEGAKANLGFEAMLQGVLLGRHVWRGRGKVGGADLSRLRDQVAKDFRTLEPQLEVDPEALDRMSGVPGLGKAYAIVRRGQAKGARFGVVEGYGIVEIGAEQNGRVFVRAVAQPRQRFEVPADRLHELTLPKPPVGTRPPAPAGAPTGKPDTSRRTRPQGAPPTVKPATVPQTAGNPKPGPNASMHPPNSMAGAPKPGEGPAGGGKKTPAEKTGVPWSAKPVDAGTGEGHGGHGDPGASHAPQGMEPPGDGLPQTVRTAVAEPPSGPGKTRNGRATQDPTHSPGNGAPDPRADYSATQSRSTVVDDGAGSRKSAEGPVGGKPGRDGGAGTGSGPDSRRKPYGRSGSTSSSGTPPPGGAPAGGPPPNAGGAPPGGPPPNAGNTGRSAPKPTTAPAQQPGAVGVSGPGRGELPTTQGQGRPVPVEATGDPAGAKPGQSPDTHRRTGPGVARSVEALRREVDGELREVLKRLESGGRTAQGTGRFTRAGDVRRLEELRREWRDLERGWGGQYRIGEPVLGIRWDGRTEALIYDGMASPTHAYVKAAGTGLRRPGTVPVGSLAGAMAAQSKLNAPTTPATSGAPTQNLTPPYMQAIPLKQSIGGSDSIANASHGKRPEVFGRPSGIEQYANDHPKQHAQSNDRGESILAFPEKNKSSKKVEEKTGKGKKDKRPEQIKEWEGRLIDEWGLKEVYLGETIHIAQWTYTGLKSLRELGLPLPKRVLVDATSFATRGRVAQADIDTRSLHVNPLSKYFSSRTAMREQIRDDFDSGYASTSHEHHILRHECAHFEHADVVGAQVIKAEMTAHGAFPTNLVGDDGTPKPIPPGDPIDTARLVSGRAVDSASEFVAEVRAKALNGESVEELVREWYYYFGGPTLP